MFSLWTQSRSDKPRWPRGNRSICLSRNETSQACVPSSTRARSSERRCTPKHKDDGFVEMLLLNWAFRCHPLLFSYSRKSPPAQFIWRQNHLITSEILLSCKYDRWSANQHNNVQRSLTTSWRSVNQLTDVKQLSYKYSAANVRRQTQLLA